MICLHSVQHMNQIFYSFFILHFCIRGSLQFSEGNVHMKGSPCNGVLIYVLKLHIYVKIKAFMHFSHHGDFYLIHFRSLFPEGF